MIKTVLHCTKGKSKNQIFQVHNAATNFHSYKIDVVI